MVIHLHIDSLLLSHTQHPFDEVAWTGCTQCKTHVCIFHPRQANIVFIIISAAPALTTMDFPFSSSPFCQIYSKRRLCWMDGKCMHLVEHLLYSSFFSSSLSLSFAFLKTHSWSEIHTATNKRKKNHRPEWLPHSSRIQRETYSETSIQRIRFTLAATKKSFSFLAAMQKKKSQQSCAENRNIFAACLATVANASCAMQGWC